MLGLRRNPNHVNTYELNGCRSRYNMD